MSGGDVDVEPSLSSRNTLGNGEPQLKFSKSNATKSIGVGSGQVVVWFGFAEVRWWWPKGGMRRHRWRWAKTAENAV